MITSPYDRDSITFEENNKNKYTLEYTLDNTFLFSLQTIKNWSACDTP